MKQIQFYPTTFELLLLLEGRQTAIVRSFKYQPSESPDSIKITEDGNVWFINWYGESSMNCLYYSPFGGLKTNLWCKETWTYGLISDGDGFVWSDEQERCSYFYKADNQPMDDPMWRPAISMPKSACRLWLQVLEVKVCKASEVTDEMALKLGFNPIQKEEPIKIVLNSKESFNWFWDHEYPNQEWLWWCSVNRIEKP